VHVESGTPALNANEKETCFKKKNHVRQTSRQSRASERRLALAGAAKFKFLNTKDSTPSHSPDFFLSSSEMIGVERMKVVGKTLKPKRLPNPGPFSCFSFRLHMILLDISLYLSFFLLFFLLDDPQVRVERHQPATRRHVPIPSTAYPAMLPAPVLSADDPSASLVVRSDDDLPLVLKYQVSIRFVGLS